jgi:hypothetical protein
VSRKDQDRDILLARPIDQNLLKGLSKPVRRRLFVEQQAHVLLGETVSIRASQQIVVAPRIIRRPREIGDAIVAVLPNPDDQGEATLPTYLDWLPGVAAFGLQSICWIRCIIAPEEQQQADGGPSKIETIG